MPTKLLCYNILATTTVENAQGLIRHEGYVNGVDMLCDNSDATAWTTIPMRIL